MRPQSSATVSASDGPMSYVCTFGTSDASSSAAPASYKLAGHIVVFHVVNAASATRVASASVTWTLAACASEYSTTEPAGHARGVPCVQHIPVLDGSKLGSESGVVV